MNSLIKQYINKIDINNINDFGIKNNIYLDKKELDCLYDVIKNRYDEIIKDDSLIKDCLKDNLKKENYDKILNLYEKYRALYGNYLL